MGYYCVYEACSNDKLIQFNGQSNVLIRQTSVQSIEYTLTEDAIYLSLPNLEDQCQDTLVVEFEETATFINSNGKTTSLILSASSFDGLGDYGITAGYGLEPDDPFEIVIYAVDEAFKNAELTFSVKSSLVIDTVWHNTTTFVVSYGGPYCKVT